MMRRASNKDESTPTFSAGAMIGLCAIGLACLAAGIGMLTVRHLSMRDQLAMQSWDETPCVVERCEFVSGDEGEKSLEIAYRYDADGKTYHGDRLDAIIGRMGDDDEFEKRVHDSFPPGATATCFVDPADPSRSVFDRRHGADAPRRMWLLAFPFMCVGVGFAIVAIGSFFGGGKKQTNASPDEAGSSPVLRAPPPREIPLLTRLSVLAGPSSTQLIWLFVVGFAYVFIILDGPASYARLVNWFRDHATTIGHVTDERELDQQESYVSVHEYSVEYIVDGETYTNKSFTRGAKYDAGDEVPITYDPRDPSKGTIAGARESSFTWLHSAIPLGVLLLLLWGLVGMYVHNYRAMWLIRHGVVVRATWPAPTTYQEGIEDSPGSTMVSKFRFEVGGKGHAAKWFTAPDKKARRVLKLHEWKPGDEVDVLYRPNRPKWNVIVDDSLNMMIGPHRSASDRIIDCVAAPIAIGLIVLLIRGAGLV